MKAKDFFEYGDYHLLAQVTQTSGGQNNTILEVKPNLATVGMFIYLLVINAKNYAAGRTVSAYLTDGTNETHRLNSASINNQSLCLVPQRGDDVGTADSIIDTTNGLWLKYPDKLQVKAASLAQNEILSVTLRALINHTSINVNKDSSSGTATLAKTIERVVE
jgi:hypothetical protein